MDAGKNVVQQGNNSFVVINSDSCNKQKEDGRI